MAARWQEEEPAPRALILAPYMMIRLAGLAPSALDGFESKAVLTLATQLDDIEDELSRRRDQLCERLHGAIQDQRDGMLRRQLMTLKRDVYNARPPGRGLSLVASAALEETDQGLAADLGRWSELLRARSELHARAGDAVAADVAKMRDHLRTLWQHPVVRTGVLFAQPQLYRNLDSEPDYAKDRFRKAQDSLLAYCYRAATKTSPFSTFTAVAIGSTCAEGGRSLREAVDLNEAIARTRPQTVLHAGLVQRLADTLHADPLIRADLSLRAADVMEREGSAITFLATERGDEGAEAIRTIARTPAVDLVLRLLEGRREQPLTVERLSRAVAHAAQVEIGKATQLIGKLIDCGLVIPSLNYAANDARAILGLAKNLEQLASDRARLAGKLLTGMQSFVEALAASPVDGRPSLMDSLRSAAEDCDEKLAGQRGTRPDRVVVRHNEIVTAVLRPKPDELQAFVPALARLASVLPLFDAEMPYRSLIWTTFTQHYGHHGECPNVLDLFQRVCEADSSGSDDLDGGSVAGAWEDHRRSFVRSLRTLMADRRGASLPDSFLAGWVQKAAVFPVGTLPPSISVLGQIAHGEGEPLFVLNKVLPGHGMPITPYASDGGAKSQSWLAQSLRDRLPTLRRDAEIVELVGTFGFDGSIRPRLTERCLIYPGDDRLEGDDSAIPWTDLVIAADHTRPRTLALKRKSTGRPVVPMHFGTLGSVHLPPFYRFVKSFGTSYSPDWSPLDHLEASGPVDAGAVRLYPRLEHGNIVQLRKTWCIPHASRPPIRKDMDPFEAFRALRRWARDLDLPQRVYITPMRVQDYLRSDQPARSFRRLHKPFYVDWDSLASHKLFHRFALGGSGSLTVSEALPDPMSQEDDAHNPRRATEYLLELTGA